MSTQVGDDAVGHVAVPPLPPGTVIPDEVLKTAERLGIAGQLPQMIAITREVFGDRFELCVSEDPELDDWTHVVADVQVAGTPEEVVEKHCRWTRLVVRRKLSYWFGLSTYYQK